MKLKTLNFLTNSHTDILSLFIFVTVSQTTFNWLYKKFNHILEFGHRIIKKDFKNVRILFCFSKYDFKPGYRYQWLVTMIANKILHSREYFIFNICIIAKLFQIFKLTTELLINMKKLKNIVCYDLYINR